MHHRAQSHHLLVQLFVVHQRPCRSSQGRMQCCRGACNPLLRLGQQVLDFSLAEGAHCCHQFVIKQRSCRRTSRLCTSHDNEKDKKWRLTISLSGPCRYKNLNSQLYQRRGRLNLWLSHWEMGTPGDGKGWKLVTAGTSGGILPHLQLCCCRTGSVHWQQRGSWELCLVKHLSHTVVPGGSRV